MPERVSIRDLRLELTTPAGVVTVPVEAQLRPQVDRATFVLDAQDAELAAPTGRLRADVHVEGALPLDVRSLADAITASGRAQLRAAALTLPGVARGIDGAGELAFSWRQGRLDGALSNLHAQLDLLAPEWGIVAQLLPAPWRIELAQPASVWKPLADDGFRLQGSGRVTLAAQGHSWTTSARPPPWTRTGGCASWSCPTARSTYATCASPGCGSSAARSRCQGSGAPEAWNGPLALELAGAGAPWPGLELEGATAQADLGVRLADRRLSLSPRAPATLRLAKLSWADEVQHQRAGGARAADSEPPLSAELADGRVQWQQHVRASLPSFEVTALAGKDAAPAHR